MYTPYRKFCQYTLKRNLRLYTLWRNNRSWAWWFPGTAHTWCDAYSPMELPFQTRFPVNRIGGASYDEESGILWLTIRQADNEAGRYSNPPVVAAFRVN